MKLGQADKPGRQAPHAGGGEARGTAEGTAVQESAILYLPEDLNSQIKRQTLPLKTGNKCKLEAGSKSSKVIRKEKDREWEDFQWAANNWIIRPRW